MAEFTEKSQYTMPVTVSTYEAGTDRRLRLSSLLRWQQEAGERQVRQFHMDWASLAEEGLAFVLASGSGVIHRMPTCGEQVFLQTWSDHVSGPRFYRGYRLLNSEGDRLVESAAMFALVNVQTHRLQRPTGEFIARLPSVRQLDDAALPTAIKQLPEMAQAGEWTVRASSVDFNRHLNNTVYADLLCDFLPPDQCHLTPRAYALQYLTEAREGDTLSMQYGADGDQHFVEVANGDTRCFVGRVTL